MKQIFLYAALLSLLGASPALADSAPSTVFDLQNWKLQIPGPKDIANLKNYFSKYFYLNDKNEICFHLDAADKGTTANTEYVRSELRHLPNWTVDQTHTLSASLHVVSHLNPDKVTVLQIHGMTDDGGNAPPLLRVAVNNGDLVAVIKTDSEGDHNDTVILKKGLGNGSVSIQVTVQSKQLTITVDGQQIVSRDIPFWKFLNYFKAGCYPQAKHGTADVMFSSLSAN